MKISTFILSFCGFCIFYICNADWIDEWYEKIVDDYLGSDYEEVAPFISSISAGTKEFDEMVQQLTDSHRSWYSSSFVLLSAFLVLVPSIIFYQYVYLSKGPSIVKAGLELVASCYCARHAATNDREDIQKLVTELLEKKFNHMCGNKPGDDVPVKLLWKGGTLVESSIHCNIRNESAESNVQHLQKHLRHSKMLIKSADLGRGDEADVKVSRTPSDESTAKKMAEIRRMLESEQEILNRYVDKGAGTDEDSEMSKVTEDGCDGGGGGGGGGGGIGGNAKVPQRLPSQRRKGSSAFRKAIEGIAQKEAAKCDIPEENDRNQPAETSAKLKKPPSRENIKLTEKLKKSSRESFKSIESKAEDSSNEDADNKTKVNSESEDLTDPKLMNRIRLLESRLRLEELKNKNWINRMSRAEGILQQLNKQVERIEETRPMETLTETLKITSTVTNWAPSYQPRSNMQFTLVNQYQPFYLQMPCMSLSEVIKKEVGFPSYGTVKKSLCSNNSSPSVIPALPYPNLTTQQSFFSKFLAK